jgi:REP element-mobilizing transposase RayT
MLSHGLPDIIRRLLDENARAHGCEIIACCLLPDPMHVLACVTEQGGDVLSFFEAFKNGTANQALRAGAGRVWQRNFWDRHTRNDLDLRRCVGYILNNPVEEELCAEPEEWPYTIVRKYPWCSK